MFLEKQRFQAQGTELLEEQKSWRCKTQNSKNQLLIDRAVIENCMTKLYMTWSDFARHMTQYPGVDNKVFKIDRSSRQSSVIEHVVLQNLFVVMESQLGVVNIRRGIFQGDSFSSLLFVTALIPLRVWYYIQGYPFGENLGRLNLLLFMDDLKLHSANEKKEG